MILSSFCLHLFFLCLFGLATTKFTIYLQDVIVEISLQSHRHVSASRIFFCMDTCAMDLRPESQPSNPTQVWESLVSHKGKVTRGNAVVLGSSLPRSSLSGNCWVISSCVEYAACSNCCSATPSIPLKAVSWLLC